MPQPSRGALTSGRRLEALRRTQLLDQPAQETFDRLTRVAARAFAVPVSLLSLVDADRQFFLSQYGLGEPLSHARETGLANTFCPHVIATGAPFTVSDARTDPRVSDYHAVSVMSVAYAGVPVHGPDREVVGAMCAVSPVPRAWAEEDVLLLVDLAAAAEEQMHARWAALDRRNYLLSMGHRLRSGFAALSLETENLAAMVTDPLQHEQAAWLSGVVVSQAAAADDALQQVETLDFGPHTYVSLAAVLAEVRRRFATRPEHEGRPVVLAPVGELQVRTSVGDLCHVLDGMVSALLLHGRGVVTVSAHLDGNAVRFRVQDEGDGLPAEVARAMAARHDVTEAADRRSTVSLAERAVRALAGRLVLAVGSPSSIDLLLPHHPGTELWQSRSRHVEQA